MLLLVLSNIPKTECYFCYIFINTILGLPSNLCIPSVDQGHNKKHSGVRVFSRAAPNEVFAILLLRKIMKTLTLV